MSDTITKGEVVARLERDWKFVERAILFLDERQTEIERATHSTIYKNRMGLSVPLARIGTALAESIRMGAPISWESIANAIEVCSYHWRQAGMLMLMDMGLSIEDAALCVYPIKTPRRAPRASGRGEEKLVNRDVWAFLVEIELDQQYQRELLTSLEGGVRPALPYKPVEMFIEGVGVIAC